MRLLSKLIALLALTACSYNPNDYSCFTHIDPSKGWSYDDVLLYMPQVSDSIAQGTLSLYVRHTNDYPYSNLWLELQTQQPAEGGHITVRRDTICIELADVYGHWYGSGLGASYQVQDTVIEHFIITNDSPMRLRHIMRPDRVTGLEQVGLIFESN